MRLRVPWPHMQGPQSTRKTQDIVCGLATYLHHTCASNSGVDHRYTRAALLVAPS